MDAHKMFQTRDPVTAWITPPSYDTPAEYRGFMLKLLATRSFMSDYTEQLDDDGCLSWKHKPPARPRTFEEDAAFTKTLIVDKLLPRLPQLQPCPVSPDRIYKSLIPEEVLKLNGGGNSKAPDASTGNLMALFHFGDSFLFTVDGRDFPIKVIMDSSVVVPPEDRDWLTMDPSNPLYEPVAKWHEKVLELQEFMDFAAYTTCAMFDWADSALEVRTFFPELYEFMSLKTKIAPDRKAKRRSPVYETFSKALTPDFRKDFKHRLTAALMLPDITPDSHKIWVVP